MRSTTKLFTTLLLLLCTTIAFAQPPENNDEPCTAVPFPTGGTCGEDVVISNVGATNSSIPNPSNCNPGLPNADLPYSDIWYTANADASGSIFLEAIVGPDDPVIAVYTSDDNTCTGNFTFMGCDDDGGPGLDANLTINGLTPGQPVWIRVWGYAYGGSANEGTFIIAATSGGTPPANDDCAAADPVAVSVTESGTTTCATLGAGDPTGGSCAVTTENSVWYSFTPATSGSYDISFSNLNCIGVNNDLQFMIGTGVCGGAFTEIACNSSVASSTSFNATAGTTYYIMIDGLSGAMCDFDFIINPNCNFTNELCANAATIPGLSGSDVQQCLSACNEGVPTPNINTAPSACGDISGPVLWYQVTTDALDELLDVSVTSSDFDPHILFWTDCSTYITNTGYCDVATAGTASMSALPVTGATTYYISVSAAAGLGTGDFDICMTSYPNPCTPSDDCSNPTDIGGGAALPTNVPTCLTNECNIGALGGITATPNCGTVQGGVTWYEMTLSGSDDMVDITVTSVDIPDPLIVVWSNCATYSNIFCASGTGGTATLSGYDAGYGGTVLVSVTSASGANTGDFDICATAYPNTDACNIDNDLYINSSTPAADGNGNYLPGTTVEFCYDINQYNQVNVNFLHGVVPTLGNAYDASTLTATVTPAPAADNEVGSAWTWHPAGDVLYNDIFATYGTAGKYPDGTPMGEGWWFHSVNSPSYTPPIGSVDPDDSWGDGCSIQLFTVANAATCIGGGGTWLGGAVNNCALGCVGNPTTGMGLTWQFCFSAQTLASYDCTQPMDFGVSVETFADGETGIWDDLGCIVDAPTQLSVPAPSPAPIYITLDNVTDITCFGDDDGEIDATATGGYGTLLFNIDGGSYSATDVFSNLTPGTHTVGVIDDLGCTATLDVDIVEPAMPLAPPLGYNNPICVGADLDLTATPGSGITATNYSWSGPASFSSTSQNPTITNVTLANAGTYTLTADINGCPSQPGTIDVVVNDLPTATVSPDPVTVCVGSTVNVSGNPTGGSGSWVTHAWTGTGSGDLDDTSLENPVYTGNSAGNFALTYTVTDDYGCVGSDNVNVTVNPLPTAVVSGGGTICAGDPIPDVTITLTGNGPWSVTYSDGSTSTTVNPASSPYTISGGGDGTYTVTAVSDVNCTGTSMTGSATITTNPLPTATVSGGGTICAGDPIPDVNIALTGNGPWSVTYSDGSASTTVNPASSPYTISGGGDGTYTVTAVSDVNCTGTSSGSATITTNPLPTATVSGGGTICAGDPIPDVTITLTGNGPWSVTYSDGSTSTTVNPASSPYTISGGGDGTYTVTAVSDANCTGTFSGSATIATNPLPTAAVSGGGTICAGDPIPTVVITLTGTGPWDVTYNDGTSNTTINTATSPYVISGGIDGAYTIVSVNDVNCTGTSSGSATILTNPIPTATVSGGGTICAGEPIPDVSIALTGTGPWDITYSDGSSTTTINTNSNPYVISGAGDGTYTIVSMNDANCTGTSSGSATITTNPLPLAPTAGTDATYCDGDAIADLFAAGSGGALTWYDDAGLTNVVGTGTSLTPSGAIGTTTYYVTETLLGCEGPASMVTVTVNALLTIDAITSGDVSNCGATDGSVTITVSGGTGSYQFSLNGGAYVAGTSPYTFSSLGVNSYVVDVTDGNCTVTSSSVTVSNPAIPPAPVAGTDATYCDGDAMVDLTATAGSGGTLTWYDDGALTNVVGTGTTLTPSNTIGATTYYVTETVAGCESPSTQVTVTINALPLAPVAGTNAVYCDGDAIADLTATAGSGGTLNWYDDAGLTNNIGTGAVYSPATAVGSYTYYVAETVAGCEGPASMVTVDINPLPSFTVTPTDPITCGGVEGELLIDGLDNNTSYNVTYTDDGNAVGPTSLTSNGSGQILISGLNAGSYTNIIVELNGCSTTDSGPYNLSDPNAPVYTVSTTDPATCGGMGDITLVGLTPGAAYNVTYDDDGTTVGPTSMAADVNGDILISNLDAGVYDNFVVEASGCSTPDAGPYVLSDPIAPTFTVSTSDPTSCASATGSITLSNLTPGATYNVTYDDDGATVGPASMTADVNGDILISNLDAGSYTNITVEEFNCSTTDPLGYTLSDPGAPTYSVLPNDPTTCGGNDGYIVLTGLNPGDTYNVTYSDDGSVVGPTGMTADPSGIITISNLDAGSYTNIVVELLGCTTPDAGPYTLSDPAAPVPPIASADASYCDGDVVTDVSGAANGGGTLNWYDDAGLTNNIGTGATYTPGSTVGTYTYYITETINNCESQPDSVTVIVNSLPADPVASVDASYCPGDTVADVSVTGAGGTYIWYDDAGLTNQVGTGSSITPSGVQGSTTYYVIEEDANGCQSGADDVVVTVNAGPTASFVPTPDNGNIPLQVYFDNTSVGGNTYGWDLGDGTTSSQFDPTNTYTEVGTYTATLTVTDTNGCVSVYSADITTEGTSTLIIPNVFSPNNDGVNDVFNLSGTNIVEVDGAIINRWGQVLFTINALQAGWDGMTLSGVPAAEGTYYYIIKATGADGTQYEYEGPLQLIR